MMKPKLIFVKPIDAPFIQWDEQFLATHFRLKIISQDGARGFRFLIFQLKLCLILLYQLPAAKGVFVWFADYHAFFPVLLARLFGKKSIVVIGGYDATSIPSLRYGTFYRPLRAILCRYAVRHADLIVPVAEALGRQLLRHTGSIKGELIPIPTGYDDSKWQFGASKEDLIVTVAAFETESRFKLKGLDFFIRVAQAMPEYQFVLIGASEKGRLILPSIPANLQVLNKMPQPQLAEYYAKAKVYAQFSLSEGLPNAVCEAMLCGCVPVGCDVG
jgi:glycosyltransferase involved in cell wall biosynthesis